MATQNRAPTSDEAVSGTWTGSAGTRYQAVDDYPDTVPADYLAHGTAAGNLTFGFTAFSVPAGATSISVQVRYYDAEASAGNNNCAGRLKVGGTYYNAATHNPSGSTYTARSDNWAVNPKTAAAWTVDDVNGVGANALQAFGFYSGDANPAIRFSCVQLQVTYTPAQYAIAAGSGSYSDTGTAASLEKGHKVAAGEGSYAETGTSATLRRGFSVSGGPGSYYLSGSLAALMADRKLSSEIGSYSLAGIDAALRWERAVIASSGGYALTGQPVSLILTQQAKVVVAGVGGFTLVGQGAALRKSSILPSSAGDHAVSGAPAILLAARKITAAADGYVEEGQYASLLKGWRLVSGMGSFPEVGQDAALLAGRVLATEEGSYLLLGIDAELLSSTSAEYILIADSGVLSLFGTSAALRGNFASASQAYAAVARGREYEAQARRRTFEAVARKRNYYA